MCNQRFGQDCLLVAFFQGAYGGSRHAFCFGIAAFGQQSARASIVNLCDHAHVTQCKKEVARAIEMLVCFLIFSHREEQITEIVFNPREIANVSSQFKMKTRGRVFHQCAI